MASSRFFVEFAPYLFAPKAAEFFDIVFEAAVVVFARKPDALLPSSLLVF